MRGIEAELSRAMSRMHLRAIMQPHISRPTAKLARLAVMTTRARFEELVAEALDGLPDWVLERLDNVEVVVEDRPPRDEPGLLGLYHGIPLTERDGGYAGVLPDTITLYRSTIERSAGRDEEKLREIVAHTVVHEFAHFFGISDDRLREMGAY